MEPFPSSHRDEHGRKMIKLLKDLGSFESNYPPELLAARRAAFLAEVEELRRVNTGEELSAGDRKIIKLIGNLKSTQGEYPAELLATRRSAFLSEMAEIGGRTSLFGQFRDSIQRIFQKITT